MTEHASGMPRKGARWTTTAGYSKHMRCRVRRVRRHPSAGRRRNPFAAPTPTPIAAGDGPPFRLSPAEPADDRNNLLQSPPANPEPAIPALVNEARTMRGPPTRGSRSDRVGVVRFGCFRSELN